jgi:trimethylamine--corrinoid protein Co-methyltransferase
MAASMKSRLSILSEAEIEVIHSSSIKILERVGLLVRSQKVAKLLVDAGAIIDSDRKTVKLPSSLVEECLLKHLSSFTLHGRSKENDLLISCDRTYAHSSGGCLNILEANSGRVRTGTIRDVEVLTRIIDASDNIHESQMLLYASDAPSQVRDVHTVAAMLRNTTKVCGFAAYNNRNLEHIMKLVAIIAGGQEELRTTPIVVFGASPTSPLELSEDIAEQFVRAASHGLPISITPAPLAGGTSPVTLAGTLVQQNAEFLLCDVIVQLVNPGNPVFYCARPMCMDMRTGHEANGVEFGLMSAASVQLAARYRLPSDVYGLYTDSKFLGEQTAFEKSMIGLVPALAGATFLSGAGAIEGVVTASPEQLVIDNEILGMIFRAARGIDVDSETLAVSIIEKIGPGGYFLGTEHTRKYYSREHYIPELCDRSLRTGSESPSNDSVGMAHWKIEKLLKDHWVEPLDRDVEDELQSALAAANHDAT